MSTLPKNSWRLTHTVFKTTVGTTLATISGVVTGIASGVIEGFGAITKKVVKPVEITIEQVSKVMPPNLSSEMGTSVGNTAFQKLVTATKLMAPRIHL